MKKTSILIAMFAVIASAAAARAELSVNFDGGKSAGGTSFIEAVKAVEISQTINPSAETYTWPPLNTPDLTYTYTCAFASMCSGMQYLAQDCTCKPLPEYQDFYNHIPSDDWWAYALDNGSGPAPQLAGTQILPVARSLAARYPAQKGLRDLILAQVNVHDAFSSGIFQALHDEKAMIMYTDKGVYLVSGNTLYGTNNKELVQKVKAGIAGQTRFGWVDVGAAAVFGCVFSSECREDVANYVNNLHDDEHDTYHNNHDGSGSNYEVNKKVK